ncbi:hypothetical protein M8J77_013607 [Diaphorina citri]|nr:hypothetical protein M8J77_013607 [Diaphorina citri]
MVRYSQVRSDTVRSGTERYDIVRYGQVRYGTVSYSTIRYGTPEQSDTISPHIENSIVRFTTMLTEPILSHKSEYPFPVVPTVLKLAGQGTSDSADSRARLVLYEPTHSGSITHLVDKIDRHRIAKFQTLSTLEESQLASNLME